ncbi:MAG: ATP-binding cassette domain-containing protein, partial [Anaerolineaceae bacterium]
MSDHNIIIQGAREGNLKNISLEIPRGRLTVITGVSGSGKTTLALDVLFMECQRRYLEAIGMQGIRKPKVDSIRNISPAIHISQSETNRNPRSTVGTSTDIYTDLRMVYEKLAERECPNCHEIISAADCKEETETVDGDFFVYMYCNRCGYRMDKLTRTHYSYNTREGACPTCKGYGRQLTLNQNAVLHEDCSLEDGAVDFWVKGYREYMISCVYNAYRHYGLPVPQNEPLAGFSPLQRAILLEGVESQAVKEAFPETGLPKTVAGGRFEGVFTSLWRRMSDHGGDAGTVNEYFDYAPCPECGGERL